MQQVDNASGNAALSHLAGKYLTFFIANEEYGVEILKVQEIISLMHVTEVPRTPSHVRGVINLRGKIIPVIDLRIQFRMPAAEATRHNCIIVVQTRGTTMGIIVDRVHEVLAVSESEIDEAPSFGSNVNTDYLLGMGKAEGRVKMLLDIDRVLSTVELAEANSAAAAAADLAGKGQ